MRRWLAIYAAWIAGVLSAGALAYYYYYSQLNPPE